MRLIKSEPDDDNCCDQSEMDNWPPNTPTSPLDLSMRSKTFKFSHPRTPDETLTKSSPFGGITKRSRIDHQESMEEDFLLEPPEILIQPKTEWHYRNIRDLAKQHIPSLSGDGPQRTPIRIRVPKLKKTPLYLSIKILDCQGQRHRSKVIIPAKTCVNASKPGHENNLDCLEFDKCNPNDQCFPREGHIISKISEEEHSIGYKDVRICMFNLYQNSHLTKEIIEMNRLHLCQLSFQFCTLNQKQFLPISDATLSMIITEKRNTTQTRNQTTSQSQLDYPFNGFIIPVIPQRIE